MKYVMHVQRSRKEPHLRSSPSLRSGRHKMTTKSIVLLALAAPMAASFTISSCSRRQLMTAAAAASSSLLVSEAAFATGNMPAVIGEVTKMDSSVKKASTPAAAKKQIAAGYVELGKLADDFDKVTSTGGGDGVRRVLGTVGTESPVYLIEPAFRLLFEEDDTLPMEYIEKLESLMRNLSSADSEAYSAIFIEFSSAKGKPADYFARSKAAVKGARADWKEMMGYLGM
jgi:hypothetical protein